MFAAMYEWPALPWWRIVAIGGLVIAAVLFGVFLYLAMRRR
jgi:type IV secretory pathway TrbF-like protein